MEAGALCDIHWERAAGVSARDLCESAASRFWVPQDEAVKEGDTHRGVSLGQECPHVGAPLTIPTTLLRK